MGHPISLDTRMKWAAVAAAALLTLAGALFSAGKTTGASAADLRALSERQANIEQRQDRLENSFNDKLDKLVAGQARLEAEFAGLEGRMEGKMRARTR